MKIIFLVLLFVFSICEKYDTPVIGIDLGTTYSAVGIYRNKKVEIIPNEQGNRITPSIVSFTPSGGNLVGDSARNNIYYNPKNTLYDVKRLIGRTYEEVIKKDAKLLTYDVKNVDGKPVIDVEVGSERKKFRPEEISAMVLTKMKNIAESYLGTQIKHAVITVPAYFNDAQRQSTKDAATISGLNVIRIINEPTAAAMAYGLYEKNEKDILVFDLGGGTFDVSILTIENGTFQVLSTSGDTHLGGEDFDLRVVDYFSKMIKEKHQKDIKADPKAFQKLKISVEKAKRILSTEVETEIEIESLVEGLDFKQKLSRAKFEDLNKDLFQNTLKPVQQALTDAKLQKDDIDEVILVGGSTRIPFIRNQLQKFFNGKKLNLDVNPDEAIAYGAAVQAAVLSETMENSNILLMDVTPLSLGIETVGGVMAKIIHRNTPIPTEKFDFFTTTEDYQKSLVVPIYEGERTQTKHNRLLGELELSDLPPARKGVPQIKVLFKLDKDGILTVTVADQANLKNTKSTTIKKSALTSQEIKAMTEDAEKNKKEDEEFRETVEIRNNLESYTSTLKTQLSDKNIANRMKSVDRKNISKALRKALKWLRDNENASKKEYKKQLKQLRKVAVPVINKIFGRKEDFDLNLDDDDDDEEEEKKKPEVKPEDLKKEETISVVEDKAEEKKAEEKKPEEKKPEEKKKDEL